MNTPIWYPSLTLDMAKLRELTHSSVHWNRTWSDELNKEFLLIKQTIKNNLELNPYDSDLETHLFVDA